ncbi:hypothetical protein [Kaistia soli]|uniref:hypothetical protein n=1 Tax=Kaistia soli TaxID=446684 RepID=UPI0015881580|nr:hypothetical protein [Kaistia soli]
MSGLLCWKSDGLDAQAISAARMERLEALVEAAEPDRSGMAIGGAEHRKIAYEMK